MNATRYCIRVGYFARPWWTLGMFRVKRWGAFTSREPKTYEQAEASRQMCLSCPDIFAARIDEVES